MLHVLQQLDLTSDNRTLIHEGPLTCRMQYRKVVGKSLVIPELSVLLCRLALDFTTTVYCKTSTQYMYLRMCAYISKIVFLYTSLVVVFVVVVVFIVVNYRGACAAVE